MSGIAGVTDPDPISRWGSRAETVLRTMHAGRGDQQKHEDHDDDFRNGGHKPDQGARALRWRAVGQAGENRAGHCANKRND